MKKEYDVVVIDSGYTDIGLPLKVLGHNILNHDSSIDDVVGHGTAILNIIYNKSPSISAYVIKAFQDVDGLNYNDLCDALQFIIDNISCKVLNLSFGFDYIDNHTRLHNLIKQLFQAGTIIVSSFDNGGHMSFPAAYDEVIGVDVDRNNNTHDFYYIENSIVNIRFGYRHIKTVNQNKEKIIVQGTSYAAACITGIILDFVKCREEKPPYTYEVIQSYLRSKSARVVSHKNINQEPINWDDPIRKAIVFPFGKEAQALAQFEHMLTFDVAGYFDSRISLNRNKTINAIVPHIQNSSIVHSYEEIDWTKDFDTVICGYCQEINRISHYDYFKEIVIKCKEHKKKLYCFENPKRYGGEADGLTYVFPHVDRKFLPVDRLGKLYPVNRPILGVFGTSSKQGKFTLQLALRNLFIKDGYRVGQISSEPSGYLFGMDFVYPFGYGSSVFLNNIESVSVINNQMERMCMKEVDIILVGGQSGTVIYDYNNLQNYLYDQYVFLTSSRPDMVLLCVNSFDEPNYIIKTKNFIETATEGTVIGLVLYPIKLSSNGRDREMMCQEELQYVIDNIKKVISLPIFINQKDDYQTIYEHILTFCSG